MCVHQYRQRQKQQHIKRETRPFENQVHHIITVAHGILFGDLRVQSRHEIDHKTINGRIDLKCYSSGCINGRSAKKIDYQISPLVTQHGRTCSYEVPPGKARHTFQQGEVENEMVGTFFEMLFTIPPVGQPHHQSHRTH